MGSWGLKSLIAVFIFAASSAQAESCDLKIFATSMAIEGQTKDLDLCLDQYTEARNIGMYSQSEGFNGKIDLVRDPQYIQFYDMFLFETGTKPLGETGRLDLVKSIYASFQKSLKNEFGRCEMKITAGTKANPTPRTLTIDDFIFYVREEGGQPGSRLMLTKDDVTAPQWELVCPNGAGGTLVEKSGNYFFVFIDVYENLGTGNLRGHLSQVLFSFGGPL